MVLGIKVGPQKSSIIDLEATQAPFCEVWFDVNKSDEYLNLFTYLKDHQIQVGLHYWGLIPGGFSTNIAHPDLAKNSVAQIKKTIDIAALNGFKYVNIHPGNQAKIRLELPDFSFQIMSKPLDLDLCINCFLENAKLLHEYSKSRNVIFTVESVPSRVLNNYRQTSRSDSPFNIYELSGDAVRIAARSGLFIANDFGHTAAGIIASDSQTVWEYLYQQTKTLFNQTRLIHLGFLVPPYNGTDFHDHLDNPDFISGNAVPNKIQMIELLKLFSGRPDVWILVEPNGRHQENYFLAKKLLESIS